MKKVFMIAMSVIMMAAAQVKAAETEPKDGDVSYELTLSLQEMRKTMGLTSEQLEVLHQTNRALRRRVAHLETMSAERRQEMLNQFVWENLAAVRPYLSDRQYHAYLSLLNTKFNETGLNGVLFGTGYYMAAE